MTGLDLLQSLSWALYILIFVLVLTRAIRRPTPAHRDMALFFGATTLTILASTVTSTLAIPEPVWLSDTAGALLVSLPYLLLRLVDDFSDVPAWLMRLSAVGLLLSILAIVVLPAPIATPVVLLVVLYFVLVIAYDTWSFAREALRSSGVTRSRMQALAAGSACVGLILLLAGVSTGVPAWAGSISALSTVLGLASGVFYFCGFAPPTWLRRAWQEPELRAFLSRAASLPRLPDTDSIVAELEHGAAASIGAPAAQIALWDPNDARLRVRYSRPPLAAEAHLKAQVTTRESQSGAVALRAGHWEVDPVRHAGFGRAFAEQRAILITDTARADPEHAHLYAAYNARALLAAPISAGEQRLGALVVYAARAPIFANSDLELIQLLADQAAVVLESRVLIEEAARVRAREEATRLKDDFLSSAAHDLKTPLTGLVTQAQLLRRRSERNPTAPVDRVGLDRLVEQAMRLRDLVLELLDASRLEQGSLVGERTPADVTQLVQDLVKREGARWRRVRVEAEPGALVEVDVVRMEQVFTNLVENGLKYSPDGGEVCLRVWREAPMVRVAVRDQGIGIPVEDQPLVFERFHRARNVDDRRFAGMGLGLYIVRGIVEQHSGRIWVVSATGCGSTFHIALPAAASGSLEGATDDFESA